MEQTPERLNEMTKEGSVEETQPGKKKRRPFVAAALIGVAVLALIFALTRGDSSEESGGKTDGAAEADGLEIQTASGTFVIADVVVGDRYPEGCAEGQGCNVAMAGYEVLVLELAPQGDADVDEVMSEGKGAYVVSSDGDRTESFLYGWNLGEGDSKQGMVGFTPEASDHDFILYWPGNEPVELGR